MKYFKGLTGLASALRWPLRQRLPANSCSIRTTRTPRPRRRWRELIPDFQAKNPDITVKWNNFDHEATSPRSATSSPPIRQMSPPGTRNRMAPFVQAGLFEDVTDLWEKEGFNETLKSAAASMTIDGKKWGVPYTYYHGASTITRTSTRRSASASRRPGPSSWPPARSSRPPHRLPDHGHQGAVAWGRHLRHINLRTNGYEFHMDLANGKVAWTDDKVKSTFADGEDRSLHHREPCRH